MKLKKIGCFILTAMLSIGVLTACSSSTKTDAKNEGTKTENSISKDVHVGINFLDAGLDPAIEYQGWQTVRSGVAETLVKVDSNLKVQPFLAKEYKQVNDTTWEFVINDNVKFHNGKPCTAVEVANSLQRSIQLNDRAKEALKDVKIEGKDNILTVTTSKAYPYLDQVLSDPMFAIVDSEAGKDEESFKTKPICTGMFMVESFNPEKEAVMKSFDDYYGGKSKTQNLKYTLISDSNTRMLSLQSGEINVTVGLADQDLSVIEKDEKFVTEKVDSARLMYALLNPKNEFLQDKKVRQALNYAIDKQTMVSSVLASNASVADTMYPSVLGYNDENADVYKYDIEKAKKLLEEAGYKDTDGDGIVDKDGKNMKLRIAYYSQRAQLPIIAQYVQGEFKKIGVDSELIASEKLAKEQYKAGDFDVAFDSWISAYGPNPAFALNNGFTANAPDNFSGYYKNDRVEEIAKILESEKDKEKQKSLAKEASRLILEDANNIFFVFTKNAVTRIPNLKNFEVSPIDYYQINANTVIE